MPREKSKGNIRHVQRDLYVGGNAEFRGPRPWVDVRAYGAKGDGVTDDTTAIQAALNTVPSSGAILFFPSGTYLVSAASASVTALTISQSKTWIVGSGQASLIKINVAADSVFFSDLKDDIIVSDLAIQAGSVLIDAAIKINRSKRSLVQRVRVELPSGKNSFASGGQAATKNSNIYLLDSYFIGAISNFTHTNNLVVRGNIFNGIAIANVPAIGILNSTNFVVADNFIDCVGAFTALTGQYGIDWGYSQGGTITGNSFRKGLGIYAEGTSARASLVGNYIENSATNPGLGEGITVKGTATDAPTDISISGNTVVTADIGINLAKDPAGPALRRIAIAQNIVRRSNKQSININGVKDFSITGNVLTDASQVTHNTYDQIILIGGEDVYTIHGNVIRDEAANKARYGLNEASVTGSNRVGLNFFAGQATGAVSASANTRFFGNTDFTTEANVLSATFTVDATGIKTVTIAHGLSYTPSKEHCQLTVLEETNVDDWAYNLLKVDTVDATNVTAKINVSTASATGAATARLALRVQRH